MTSENFKLVDYSRIRAMLTELHHKILKLHNRKDMIICARHLGLLHNKEICFNNEYELSVLADYGIYSYRPHGINLAELYLRLNRSALDESRIDLLTRMSAARYLYLRVDAVEDQGVMRVSDLFSEEQFALADIGLSQSLKPKNALAAHIIDMGDFYIQSGAVLPIDTKLIRTEEVERVLAVIASKFGDEKIRITSAASAKLARATMSTAILLGYTDSCESLNVDE